MFQPSTICQGESGTKIYPFTYGFTTFVREKFIDSCSLGLRQMAAKIYHSAARNKAYKAIPSLLLPRPLRRSNTSLPPTLSRPSCRFKRCVLHVKISFCWSQVRHSHGQQKLHLSSFRDSNMPCVMKTKHVLLSLVLFFCTRPNLVSYTFSTDSFSCF